jgi:hypothetical protein
VRLWARLRLPTADAALQQRAAPGVGSGEGAAKLLELRARIALRLCPRRPGAVKRH